MVRPSPRRPCRLGFRSVYRCTKPGPLLSQLVLAWPRSSPSASAGFPRCSSLPPRQPGRNRHLRARRVSAVVRPSTRRPCRLGFRSAYPCTKPGPLLSQLVLAWPRSSPSASTGIPRCSSLPPRQPGRGARGEGKPDCDAIFCGPTSRRRTARRARPRGASGEGKPDCDAIFCGPTRSTTHCKTSRTQTARPPAATNRTVPNEFSIRPSAGARARRRPRQQRSRTSGWLARPARPG